MARGPSVGVLHVNSCAVSSTSPTMRIAKWVADAMGCDFVHDMKTAVPRRNTIYDVLFVKYGMLKFSDHREEALRIHERARLVVNLENDYTFVPDKRFRPADETWSTCEGRTRYVNWNVLTRLPAGAWTTRPVLSEPTRSGLFYYGAYREGRAADFVKYFKKAPYPVTVSSFRGGKKFKENCGGKVETVGAFRDPYFPSQWPLTLYVEDEESHELYTSPATRFYECLQMGLAQAVDAKAAATLRKAGIEVPESVVVDSQNDLVDRLLDWPKLRKTQMKQWWRNYSLELEAQFAKAREESGL